MIGCFRRLPDEDLARLLEDPSGIVDYLDEEEPSGFGPFADLDVDKAWHGIHFLLTGTAEEGGGALGFIVAGGTPIGDEDVGYGPARGFAAAEVARIAAALTPVTAEALAARYDARALAAAEVYPDAWLQDGDEARDYLVGHFEQLKSFLLGAAEQREALIVFLS